MEKNTYPYDPDMLKASTEFGKNLGSLMVNNLLCDMSSVRMRNIAIVAGLNIHDINPLFVYNWIFQGIADVLRNPNTQKEISQMIEDAKKLEEV